MVPYMLPGVPIVASVRKVSLREEAYNLLQTLQKQYGATSLSDTVLLLAEKAKTCKTLMEEMQAIEKRLEELETLQKKTYLALLRLLEELTGSEEEGPESPAGHGEGGDAVVGHSRTVKSTRPTYPPETPRGREPRENIE